MKGKIFAWTMLATIIIIVAIAILLILKVGMVYISCC